MAALARQPLTNCQAMPRPLQFARTPQPGLLSRIAAGLRRWERRTRERQELARLSDRELRDMRASSADVWREIRQPFWR